MRVCTYIYHTLSFCDTLATMKKTIMTLIMFEHYLSLLYLALPAFGANMIPIAAARINLWSSLAIPLDGGRTFRGHPILGANKTLRGLLMGILIGVLIALAQYALPFFEQIKQPNLLLTVFFGAAAGFGALLGDAVASFFKRQLGVKSGRPLIPLDQIDYVLGFIICTLPFVQWTLWDVLFLLIFAAIANPIVNGSAYLLGIKKTYW